MLSRPKLWRAVSTVLAVVFLVAVIVDGPIPGWGWAALIASGVAFAVELALMYRVPR